jgi:hypothetical protein
MARANAHEGILSAEEREFYCRTLSVLEPTGIEVLIGGAYAFARYTGIERHTKDLDIFVRSVDFAGTLRALETAGYQVEVTFPHWLGKAFCGEFYVDVIHSSGNSVARVDDEWFANAPRDTLFGMPVRLAPREEMIWSKAFVQERERFDGADVAHLILACTPQLDWERLLRRFGPNWRVLLAHLVLFGFVYPGERDRVPAWVLHELTRRLDLDTAPAVERICRGTLLSRQQYLTDVYDRGYRDARTLTDNPMSETDIATWTDAIVEDGSNET